MTTSVTGLRNHLTHEHSYVNNSKANEISQKLITQSFFNGDKQSSCGSNVAQMHPTLKTKEDRERFLFFRYIVVWICKDLLPFSTVCAEGFNYFWKKFNSKKHLSLPSRTTIACQALNDAYDVLKRQLIHFLDKSPGNGVITFDSWTDSHKRVGYITFTYHFINDEWKMQSTVLKTTHFEHPHTANNIRNHISQLFDEYHLQDKNIIFVTDGGSNVKAACVPLKKKRLSCVAHQLNRLIQHDLMEKNKVRIEPIITLIEKLRKIQRALVYKYEQLKNIYERDKHEQIFLMLEQFEMIEEEWVCNEKFIDGIDFDVGSFNGLKSFSTVRWGCIYILVKFHCDHIGIVKKCLQDNERYELILNANETMLLSHLVELLEVFHTITKFIQGDSYATHNLLPIFYTEAEAALTKIIERNSIDINYNAEMSGESTIRTAAEILLSNLANRLALTAESICAAIIDPAMQHLPIIDEWLEKNGKKNSAFNIHNSAFYICYLHITYAYELGFTRVSLIEKIGRDYNVNIACDETTASSNPIKSSDGPSSSEAKRAKYIESLLQSHCPNSIRSNNTLEFEIHSFMDAPTYTDPLKFWHKYEKNYPKLSKVAKVILSWPITTAKSEASFSISGCLLRSRRASIVPSRAEKVLLIHDNFHLMK